MNQTKIYFPLIFISLEDEPWEPIEPNPNAAPAEEPDIEEQDLSQSDWTLASTETVTHDYLTQNGKVARETIRQDVGGTVLSTKTLDFFYDDSGRPFAFNYSVDGGIASTYYYILNLQGDVVQIIDEGGVLQAEYVYSPWGEVISAEGDLAEINPLRYRGYYYDSETGFYYLQSRYYDPENHRFINADSFASTGQGFLGTNMFAYCNNCPTIYEDPSGHALRSNLALICDGGSGKTEPRYISDQDLPGIAPTLFGLSNVGRSGCGAVATYNALQTLNSGTSLNDIISYYHDNKDMNVFGYLGLGPNSVADYFRVQGYTVIMARYTAKYSAETAAVVNSLAQTADASILWYVYASDSGVGAHFFEYHRDGDGYVGYNVFSNKSVFEIENPYQFLRDNNGVIAINIFIYQGG